MRCNPKCGPSHLAYLENTMPRNSLPRFCCVLTLAGASLLFAQTDSIILSSAGGMSTIAPGSLATFYGSSLSTTEQLTGQTDQFGQLPTQLGGYSLEVNGMLAQLQFVGPSQLNFLIPAGAKIGKNDVILRLSDQVVGRSTVTVLPVAPSIFTYIQGGSEVGSVLNAV